ncbi:uncharacterized protein CTRU02_208227 [Colletotrichum truncatum]|uniref:Uncharacterized protein n=1 Tax=Colletotrichum truncatum TaxID=5467 RepID=A0ACC3YVV4_COLTU
MAPAPVDRVGQAAPEATTQDTIPTPSIAATDILDGTSGSTENPSSTSTTTILIFVIVVCAAAIMSAAIFYLFDRKKSRQFREACKRDPYLTRKEFSRRRKLSTLERLEEEELQRNIMIRKSLASRSTSRTSSDDELDVGTVSQQQHYMPEPPRGHNELHNHYQHRYQEPTEWLRGEVRRARSDSELSSSASLSSRSRYTEPHPGVEVEIPLPPQSRTPSPARMTVRDSMPPPSVDGHYARPLPPLPRASYAPARFQ